MEKDHEKPYSFAEAIKIVGEANEKRYGINPFKKKNKYPDEFINEQEEETNEQ